MYYEVRVKAPVADSKGRMKTRTSTYLTDCGLFAEAERAGLTACEGRGDVVAIYRSGIYEVVNPSHTEGDYYKTTIASLFTNGKGDATEQRYRVLVSAGSLEEAASVVKDYMRQGLQDMRLVKVEKSRIVKVV